jgi:hypothetical protein
MDIEKKLRAIENHLQEFNQEFSISRDWKGRKYTFWYSEYQDELEADSLEEMIDVIFNWIKKNYEAVGKELKFD